MEKKAVSSELILKAIAKRQKDVERIRKPIFGLTDKEKAKILSEKTYRQISKIYAKKFSKVANWISSKYDARTNILFKNNPAAMKILSTSGLSLKQKKDLLIKNKLGKLVKI